MPAVPSRTKASKKRSAKQAINEVREEKWEEVLETVSRRVASLDKVLTQFILSDEYITSSRVAKEQICVDLFLTLTEELFLKHFHNDDIHFAAEGLVARMIKRKAKRASPQVYIDMSKEA